jgi:hypothetical protein
MTKRAEEIPEGCGRGSSWIERFLEYTKDVNSPQIFRKWTAISCLAGAMERRFYTRFGPERVYPNCFIILVGAPGVGKTQAAKHCGNLWRQAPPLVVAPDSVSSATLIDSLESSYRMYTDPKTNETLEYHALQICADELGVLFPEYNAGTLSLLSSLFDCKPSFSEKKRTQKIDKFLHEPILNLLVGATPGFLQDTLPAVAWDQGFMARMIMIFSEENQFYDIRDKFDGTDETPLFPKEFVEELTELVGMRGIFRWTAGAREAFAAWNDAALPPAPTHSRLEHYVRRRMFHCLKLCMVSSISCRRDAVITVDNFEEARGWMLEAETSMPDIFSATAAGGDRTIILDLHSHFMRLQVEGEWQKRAVLSQRISALVRAERVSKVLELAKEMGLFEFDVFGNFRVLKKGT